MNNIDVAISATWPLLLSRIAPAHAGQPTNELLVAVKTDSWRTRGVDQRPGVAFQCALTGGDCKRRPARPPFFATSLAMKIASP